MTLKFDRERDFILMKFNSEMIAMELEDYFSHQSMGISTINVEVTNDEGCIFSVKFDEGDRRCFEIFCRRIQKNNDLDDEFTLALYEIVDRLQIFICDCKSLGGYFSSAVIGHNELYVMLSYSESVFNEIKNLSSAELLVLTNGSSNKKIYSTFDLNRHSENGSSHWHVIKKIPKHEMLEECSDDFFMSKLKDYLYNFYDMPARISLIRHERGLVCQLYDGDKTTGQLSFNDDEFVALVKNAFFEPSASLDNFTFDAVKNCWFISYKNHC